MPGPEALLVQDDERDFYGKHYFDEIAERHGLPPLDVRARADLPERCVHWLRGLLRYRLPPARILELGSAHGGYVAMMRWAGFDATGLDLSPEIVAGARGRFDVPVLEGPLESQDIAPESLDAIVLMDVMEHLGDPKETLRRCLSLLKPNGLIILQTPQYREGKSLARMEKDNDPFLRMLTPDQHLYLFSKSSVRQLFRELGVEHVTFEPAIFSFYDMALVASRAPLAAVPESEAADCLQRTSGGRLVLALLDLNRQFQDLTARYEESEADRTLRLENVMTMDKLLAGQTQQLQDLMARYAASEADRTVRLENVITFEKLLAERTQQLQDLKARYAESETDRAARLESVVTMAKLLAEKEQQLQDLTAYYAESEADRASFMETAATMERLLAEQASGYSARLAAQEQVIESQRRRLAEAETLQERLRQSHVFRIMRRLQLWGWLDGRTPGRQGRERSPSLPSGKSARGLRKVVVDLTPVLPGGENGGAKVMTVELIRHLGRLAADTEFILLTSEQSHEELATLDAPNVRRLCVSRPGVALAASDNIALRARSVLVRFLPPTLLTKLAGTYRHASELVPMGSSLVRQLDADLLFCPFTAPFFADPGIPTVCVVYDLQHAYYPQFFDMAAIQERDRNLGKAIRVASGIVCISEYVRNTLLEKTTVAPDRVETIHILLPRRLATPSLSQCEGVLKTLQLVSQRFLLYPANFWPHKNHELLLTAFGMYLADHPDSDLKLVLTGSPGARQEFLQDAACRMGIARAVVFPGYLPDAELSALLHSCMALIFPSLFEGFGMPLLEGMAAGRPLLCSNTTSLPEVAGSAAFFFDPRIPAEVAGAIARIAGDSDLRRDLAARSAQRLSAFGGPEEMAAGYLRVFRKAVQQPAEMPSGIFGVFGDGWVGERFTIAFGSGTNSRTVRTALVMPEWVPTTVLSIRVETNGTAPKPYILAPGEIAQIESTVGCAAGSIEVSCSPSFRPNLCGLGDDTRTLTCQLKRAEIVGADGVPVTLTNMDHGS